MAAKMEKICFLSCIMILMYLRTTVATNIDCSGKPFHCINATHFMICVDLGAGVSKTVDDYVIQCPPPTMCHGSNIFECEYLLPTTTESIIRPGDVTNEFEIISQTSTVTPFDSGVTELFSEYLNTATTSTQVPGGTGDIIEISSNAHNNSSTTDSNLNYLNTSIETYAVEDLLANSSDPLDLLKSTNKKLIKEHTKPFSTKPDQMVSEFTVLEIIKPNSTNKIKVSHSSTSINNSEATGQNYASYKKSKDFILYEDKTEATKSSSNVANNIINTDHTNFTPTMEKYYVDNTIGHNITRNTTNDEKMFLSQSVAQTDILVNGDGSTTISSTTILSEPVTKDMNTENSNVDDARIKNLNNKQEHATTNVEEEVIMPKTTIMYILPSQDQNVTDVTFLNETSTTNLKTENLIVDSEFNVPLATSLSTMKSSESKAIIREATETTVAYNMHVKKKLITQSYVGTDTPLEVDVTIKVPNLITPSQADFYLLKRKPSPNISTKNTQQEVITDNYYINNENPLDTKLTKKTTAINMLPSQVQNTTDVTFSDVPPTKNPNDINFLDNTTFSKSFLATSEQTIKTLAITNVNETTENTAVNTNNEKIFLVISNTEIPTTTVAQTTNYVTNDISESLSTNTKVDGTDLLKEMPQEVSKGNLTTTPTYPTRNIIQKITTEKIREITVLPQGQNITEGNFTNDTPMTSKSTINLFVNSMNSKPFSATSESKVKFTENFINLQETTETTPANTVDEKMPLVKFGDLVQFDITTVPDFINVNQSINNFFITERTESPNFNTKVNETNLLNQILQKINTEKYHANGKKNFTKTSEYLARNTTEEITEKKEIIMLQDRNITDTTFSDSNSSTNLKTFNNMFSVPLLTTLKPINTTDELQNNITKGNETKENITVNTTDGKMFLEHISGGVTISVANLITSQPVINHVKIDFFESPSTKVDETTMLKKGFQEVITEKHYTDDVTEINNLKIKQDYLARNIITNEVGKNTTEFNVLSSQDQNIAEGPLSDTTTTTTNLNMTLKNKTLFELSTILMPTVRPTEDITVTKSVRDSSAVDNLNNRRMFVSQLQLPNIPMDATTKIPNFISSTLSTNYTSLEKFEAMEEVDTTNLKTKILKEITDKSYKNDTLTPTMTPVYTMRNLIQVTLTEKTTEINTLSSQEPLRDVLNGTYPVDTATSKVDSSSFETLSFTATLDAANESVKLPTDINAITESTTDNIINYKKMFLSLYEAANDISSNTSVNVNESDLISTIQLKSNVPTERSDGLDFTIKVDATHFTQNQEAQEIIIPMDLHTMETSSNFDFNITTAKYATTFELVSETSTTSSNPMNGNYKSWQDSRDVDLKTSSWFYTTPITEKYEYISSETSKDPIIVNNISTKEVKNVNVDKIAVEENLNKSNLDKPFIVEINSPTFNSVFATVNAAIKQEITTNRFSLSDNVRNTILLKHPKHFKTPINKIYTTSVDFITTMPSSDLVTENIHATSFELESTLVTTKANRHFLSHDQIPTEISISDGNYSFNKINVPFTDSSKKLTPESHMKNDTSINDTMENFNEAISTVPVHSLLKQNKMTTEQNAYNNLLEITTTVYHNDENNSDSLDLVIDKNTKKTEFTTRSNYLLISPNIDLNTQVSDIFTGTIKSTFLKSKFDMDSLLFKNVENNNNNTQNYTAKSNSLENEHIVNNNILRDVDLKNQSNEIENVLNVTRAQLEQSRKVENNFGTNYTSKVILEISNSNVSTSSIDGDTNQTLVAPNVLQNKAELEKLLRINLPKTNMTVNNSITCIASKDKNMSVVTVNPCMSMFNKIDEPSLKQINHTKIRVADTEIMLTSRQNSTVSKKDKNIANNGLFTCLNRFRGRYSDINDCRKFYVCVGKIYPLLGECPSNTVFSEIKKQCTKNLSHCIINNQFHCIQEGRFSDVWKDNIYYICVKNKNAFVRFQFQCQSGYILNKTTVRCISDKQLQSQTYSTSIDSDSSKTSDQSTVELKSKEKKQSETDTEKSVCKKEGKFSDPDDCRRYYVCSKNSKSEFRRRTKKCDSDEVFHREKKKCVDGESYECNS